MRDTSSRDKMVLGTQQTTCAGPVYAHTQKPPSNAALHNKFSLRHSLLISSHTIQSLHFQLKSSSSRASGENPSENSVLLGLANPAQKRVPPSKLTGAWSPRRCPYCRSSASLWTPRRSPLVRTPLSPGRGFWLQPSVRSLHL